MAANTKVVLENLVDGYLTTSTQIKGGFITVDNKYERGSLNPVVLIDGSICYQKDEDKFFIYDGTAKEWKEEDPRYLMTQDEKNKLFHINFTNFTNEEKN